jgi:hypothetical protein
MPHKEPKNHPEYREPRKAKADAKVILERDEHKHLKPGQPEPRDEPVIDEE